MQGQINDNRWHLLKKGQSEEITAKLGPLETTIDIIRNEVSGMKIRESMIAAKLQTKVNEFR